MTRDIDWGIAVPLDGWRDNPTKKLYVWFDAVIGYLSASIEWARRTGDPDALARSGGTTPRRCPTTSWARTTSPSTARSGRPSCWPTPARAPRAARRTSTASSTCRPRSSAREFLTMEGKKFSSSKRVVIYVRDLLSRYQPDAFRYFVAAAGPENQDSDFTWAEFVRRTNDELVAGWGNLVNRTATLIAKNFGEIPPPASCTDEDEAVLAAAEAAFDTVGDLIGRNRHEAGDRRGDARGRPRSTSTSPTPSRGRSRTTTSASGSARSCTSPRSACADLNLVLSPFLPFSANEVDRALGGTGEVAPMPRIEEVEDLDGGAPYPIITGDYSGAPTWRRHADRGRHPGRPSRRRSSPSSTRRSSTRSWPGSRSPAPGPDPCVRASRAGPPSAPPCSAPCTRTWTRRGSSPTRWPGGSSVTATSCWTAPSSGSGPGCGCSSRCGTGSPRTRWPRRTTAAPGRPSCSARASTRSPTATRTRTCGCGRWTSPPPATGSGRGWRRPASRRRTR